MNAQIIRTKKSVNLLYGNFKFKKDYVRKERCYWKCLKSQCLARATSSVPDNDVIEVQIYKFSGVHNHDVPIPQENWEIVLAELLDSHQMVKPSIIINKLHSRCNTVPPENTIRCRCSVLLQIRNYESICSVVTLTSLIKTLIYKSTPLSLDLLSCVL